MSVDELPSPADHTASAGDEPAGPERPGDPPAPPAAEPSRQSGAYLRYLLVLAALAGLLFAAVGAGNVALNPLVYDDDTIREAARATVVDGMHYANYDPNVDLRALRKQQIRLMPQAPDVVVFGGSRWQEFRAELLPNRRVFNAFVSNDHVEDIMALTNILEEAGKLPKTLVISERYITFLPVGKRADYQSNDWQVWASDYRAMARKLDVPVNSFRDTVPVQRWTGMFYLPALTERAQQVADSAGRPHATSAAQTPDLDLLAADGSLRWSAKSEATFTKKYVDKFVKRQLKGSVNTSPAVDPALVSALGKTIDYLRSRGVQVYLVQTPYHPDFYKAIQGKPFGAAMDRLESIADQLGREHGAIVAGTFDPAAFGCVAAEYIDHIHAAPSCLGKVVPQVPGLA